MCSASPICFRWFVHCIRRAASRAAWNATIPAGGFVGLVQELRGDALVKLGRADDARKAYTTAMSALAADAPERGALKMKLDDLAVPGESAQPGKPEA